MSFDRHEACGGAPGAAPASKGHPAPGKRTQVEQLSAPGTGHGAGDHEARPKVVAARASNPSGVNLATLQQFIVKHEGKVDHVYLDSLGFPTAGIGHLLTGGHYRVGQKVSAEQITEWFKDDVAAAVQGAKHSLGSAYDRLAEARKMVIIDMVFNLGAHGFSQFRETIHAIESGAYARAAERMLQSLWASQVGNRAKENAAIMRTGHLAGGGGGGDSDAAEREPERERGGGPREPGDGGRHATSFGDIRAGQAVLKRGATGAAVTQLQRLLHISADGIFGPQTQHAVEAFQRSHQLVVDGIVGPRTIDALEHKAPAKPRGGHGGGEADPDVQDESRDGAAQRAKMLSVARSGSAGRRPDGRCYYHICQFFIQCGGYGKITNPYTQFSTEDLPVAHNFADLMNAGGARRFGLERLSMRNPYDAPAGSIVVVAAGSPGTGHPTAGDIAVADGHGQFFNGGMMGYSGRAAWNASPRARLLGVYIPK